MVENNNTVSPVSVQPAVLHETSSSDATIIVPQRGVGALNTATVLHDDDGEQTHVEEDVLNEQIVPPLAQTSTSISTSTPRQEKSSLSRLNASHDSQNYHSCHEVDESPTLDWSSFTIFKLGNGRKKVIAGEMVNKMKKI